ncbi:MAG: septum formation initiator family protein [Kiritimatiellales bacterium]|nr:septum formation initiator family protein [Kiritimatiellota bacterium]MBL7012526.1 septum formation initiator family protein [Kiritimatiellales bacterium]
MNQFYRYVVLAVVVLALIGVAFAFLPKINQLQSYQDTKTGLEVDIRATEARIKELRLNQQQFSTDKHFVQKLAHEKGFAHEGETIYQFEEPATNGEIQNTQIPKQ